MREEATKLASEVLRLRRGLRRGARRPDGVVFLGAPRSDVVGAKNGTGWGATVGVFHGRGSSSRGRISSFFFVALGQRSSRKFILAGRGAGLVSSTFPSMPNIAILNSFLLITRPTMLVIYIFIRVLLWLPFLSSCLVTHKCRSLMYGNILCQHN
jgi:hypothetical protein